MYAYWYACDGYYNYLNVETSQKVRVRKNGNHWDAMLHNGKSWVIVATFKTLKEAKARINYVFGGEQ